MSMRPQVSHLREVTLSCSGFTEVLFNLGTLGKLPMMGHISLLSRMSLWLQQIIVPMVCILHVFFLLLLRCSTVFGFPNSPELPKTGQNLGFLDQRFALEWVEKNIKAFGGNPNRVTIPGESAGALSVDALVTAPPPEPLFRAAILESGTVSLANLLRLGVNGTKNWLTLAKSLNCSETTSNLACVRAAPATTIKSIIEHAALSFQPVVDNVTLVASGSAARVSHKIANVSILTGTNGQEGRIFEYGRTDLSNYISTTFGAIPSVASEVAQAYAIGSPGIYTPYDAISQIDTEFVFQCVSQVFSYPLSTSTTFHCLSIYRPPP